MTSGLAWLNELMSWIGRWVPRLVLVKARQRGVLWGRGGRVTEYQPGLVWYWPMLSELVVVAVMLRTSCIAAQLHGREVLQVVVGWRVESPVTALMSLNDVAATMDNWSQAALAASYGPDKSSEAIQESVHAWLSARLNPRGIVVESVSVSQRGSVRALRLLSDWATHEQRGLEGKLL